MTDIKTAEDWWAEYERIQDDIKSYIPDMGLKEVLERMRGLRLQSGRTELLKMYEEGADKTIYDLMDQLRDAKDKRLHLILDSIWADAPDSPVIHEWPNWGNFCDLCSEGWAVRGEE